MLALLLLILPSVSLRSDSTFCLSRAETVRTITLLEDRLLLITSDSLRALQHNHDSAALRYADTAIVNLDKALRVCQGSLRLADSTRTSNVLSCQSSTLLPRLKAFGLGVLTGSLMTTTALLLWVLY